MPLAPDYVTASGVVTRGGIKRTISRVYHQKWGLGGLAAPIAAATNNILTAKAGPNTTTILYSVFGAPLFDGTLFSGGKVLLDYPRNVVITVTHGSAVVAESGVITGFDLNGDQMTEAWSVTAGGTTKTFTGKKAFLLVTSVSVTAVADASADTNVIGTGNVLGCDVMCSLAGVNAAVKELVDAAVVATGTLVAASAAATDDYRGTYLPVTVPNGAHTYEVAYLTDNPEAS